jgi:hypothetical protein
MDRDNFIIFPNNIFFDNHREIPNCVSVYKDNLISEIDNFANKLGFVVKGR